MLFFRLASEPELVWLRVCIALLLITHSSELDQASSTLQVCCLGFRGHNLLNDYMLRLGWLGSRSYSVPGVFRNAREGTDSTGGL